MSDQELSEKIAEVINRGIMFIDLKPLLDSSYVNFNLHNSEHYLIHDRFSYFGTRFIAVCNEFLAVTAGVSSIDRQFVAELNEELHEILPLVEEIIDVVIERTFEHSISGLSFAVRNISHRDALKKKLIVSSLSKISGRIEKIKYLLAERYDDI